MAATLSSGSATGTARVALNVGSGQLSNTVLATIGGIQWSLSLRKDDPAVVHRLTEREKKHFASDKTFQPHLCFALVPVVEGSFPFWLCKAHFDFILFNADSDKNLVESDRHTWKGEWATFSFWETVDLILWEDVIDPAKGYMVDGKLTLEAKITVESTTGMRKVKTFDFSTASALFDGILVIEGKRVHVNKGVLTTFSPFFEMLFLGDFKERNQDEITIQDVSYESFTHFLNFIYPTNVAMSEFIVDEVLLLADRFVVETVVARCELFLLSADHMQLQKKVFLADRFRLEQLMIQCMKKLDNEVLVNKLKKSDEYASLSDATKVVIDEKLASFVKDDESSSSSDSDN